MTRSTVRTVGGIIAGAMAATIAWSYLGVGSIVYSNIEAVSPEARLAAIRTARVWTPTDVRAIDIKAGPQGAGAFAIDQTVRCDYVAKRTEGASPKFACAVAPGDEVKVKYGRDNGEVYAEVAASRLLWALGFGADRMYPVRVVCRGCPWLVRLSGESHEEGTLFDVAAIERKMPGVELEGEAGPGWAWPELDLVDPAAGGASRAERDALKLLAVIIQHTDNKPSQQRLTCAGGSDDGERGRPCAQTFMLISDVGQTFGSANVFNRSAVGSVNLEQWSQTPVWLDRPRCVGNLFRSITGTLEHPSISEEGRRFLAGLLAQLSDRQVRDLFEVARFALRGQGIEAWVDAFKQKRDEIVNQRCPSAGAPSVTNGVGRVLPKSWRRDPDARGDSHRDIHY